MNEPSHRPRAGTAGASLADLFERGRHLRRRGHCETASWFLDLAYRRAPPEDGDTGRAEITLELAWAKTECGAHREAAALLESLDQRRLAEDAAYVYIVLTAFLHHDACRFRSALEILRHGRTWVRGRKHPLSATLESREAALYADLGQVDRARRLFVEAIRSFDDRGASASGHIARLNQATLDVTSGRPEHALEKIHEVRVFAGNAIDLRLRTLLDLKEGEALLLYGDRQSARKRLEIAERRAREAGLRWEADWGGVLLGLVDPDRVDRVRTRLLRASQNAQEDGRKLDLATLDILALRAAEFDGFEEIRIPPDRARRLLGERQAIETLDVYLITLLEAARRSPGSAQPSIEWSRNVRCPIAVYSRDAEVLIEMKEAIGDPEVHLLHTTDWTGFERALPASRLAIVHRSGALDVRNDIRRLAGRNPTVPLVVVNDGEEEFVEDDLHRSVVGVVLRRHLSFGLHPTVIHARYERFILALLHAIEAASDFSPVLRTALHHLCAAHPPVRTVVQWSNLAKVNRRTLDSQWRSVTTPESSSTLKEVVDAVFLVRVLQARLTPGGELSWNGVADSLEVDPAVLHRFVKRLSGSTLHTLSRSPRRESILEAIFDPIVATITGGNERKSLTIDS